MNEDTKDTILAIGAVCLIVVATVYSIFALVERYDNKMTARGYTYIYDVPGHWEKTK